jgi:hypothetical protein
MNQFQYHLVKNLLLHIWERIIPKQKTPDTEVRHRSC